MYACLDLGSNSFHLLVARLTDDGVEVVERFSEKVQLGEGLSASGVISPAAFQRGLECLQRFQNVINNHPIEQYWALGTNALRVARNAEEFLEAAKQIGFEISVITGTQEAILVFAGVNSVLPDSADTRLVIDIGGGSTEMIIGRKGKRLLTHSLPIGCVSWRDCWFNEPMVSTAELEKALDLAIDAACKVFRKVRPSMKNHPWQSVYASSGTAKMLAAVCQENGLSSSGIHLDSLLAMRPLIVQSVLEKKLLPGLKENRSDLLMPGWSVLTALMQTYAIDTVYFSATALREGMLDFMMKNSRSSSNMADRGLPETTLAMP